MMSHYYQISDSDGHFAATLSTYQNSMRPMPMLATTVAVALISRCEAAKFLRQARGNDAIITKHTYR